MDQLIKDCRNHLSHIARKEFDKLEHAMREELARRDREQSSERLVEIVALQEKNQGLQEEIYRLQQQTARTHELEQKLKQLRASAASKSRASSNTSLLNTTVGQGQPRRLIQNPKKPSGEQNHAYLKDIEHYRQLFIECSKELDRVKKAREILEMTFKAWKERVRHSLDRNGERDQADHREDPSRPGSAPVTQPNQGSDVLASIAPESISNVSGRPVNLPGFEENSKATLDTCIDQDDAETSDESDHLAAAKDPANVNGLPKNNELSTSHPPMKKSQSEEPVITRETAVSVPAKRKRDRSPANASRRPNPMKEEILASSPIVSSTRRSNAVLQESIDLDELSGDIYTPRKDRSKRQQIYRTRSLSPPIQPILDARSPKKNGPKNPDIPNETCNSDLAISEDEKDAVDDIAEVQDDAYYKRLGEEYAAQIQNSDKWKREEQMRTKQRPHNTRQLSKYRNMTSAEMWHPSAAMQKQMNHTHVLQPTDVNVVLPRTNDIPQNKKRKSNPRSDHGVRYIQQLAEDGEKNLDTENEPPVGGPRDPVVGSKRSGEGLASLINIEAEERQRRLDQLLTRPSPEKPLLNANMAQVSNVPSTFKAHKFFPDQVAGGAAPKTPNFPREDRSNARDLKRLVLKPVNTPDYRSPYAKPSSKKPTKDLEPALRFRPLSQLALNDFKINPNHNQGYDYAFKEVVRKQDQRKCLPGCTRLDCCGAIFRKMAATMSNHFYHTSRLPNSSQEYDEQGMMEDYLGDQAWRLKSMSTKDKAETLLQAKTKIMADHYGRHRESYAREPSPVGYWDVDMPTSQEAAEMGRLAEMRTRKKVEERYHEAVKQDGQWKFRDE
ncbi:MAG: hypothetical protein LQ349_003760 [Xanthoria aureola]|nr:MAG: hypothetical protein LQ349_003760 [Xanthoria aureola]